MLDRRGSVYLPLFESATPEVDNLSRIATMPPARMSDPVSSLLGIDQFNEFASRFRLVVTTWYYANALPHALHWPVFAQVCVSESAEVSIPFRLRSLARLHESSGEIGP